MWLDRGGVTRISVKNSVMEWERRGGMVSVEREETCSVGTYFSCRQEDVELGVLEETIGAV